MFMPVRRLFARLRQLLAVLALLGGIAMPRLATGQTLKKLREEVRGEKTPDSPPTDSSADAQRKAEEEARRKEEERRERQQKWHRRSTPDQCQPNVQAGIWWSLPDDRSTPVPVPPLDHTETPTRVPTPYPTVSGDFQPVAADPLPEPLHYDSWLRVTLDVATYEDNIDQYGTRFLIGHPGRVYIDSEVNWLVEHFGGASDGSAIGDINAILIDLRSQWSELRAGLGANWLHDESTDLGFNVTSDLELCLSPWKAKVGADWGTLGDAEFLHARATGGVEFDRMELFAGYDFRAIGDVHFGGPVVGLTLAF